MTQKKILFQYYFFTCLFSAGGMQIISAVYVTYLLRNGLNLFEVNLVNAIYFFALFACEIPTGAFADIFGRKTAYITACILVSLSMFLYGYSDTFTGFAAAEILAAIGFTFKNGAFQAWVVDSMKHRGHVGSFTPIFAKANLSAQVSGGIGAIFGSYLAAANPRLPWFVGGSTMMIGAILVHFVMKEEYFVRGVFSWRGGLHSMKMIAKSSFRYAAEDKAVRFILGVSFIQIYAIKSLDMYWQPFFREKGLGDTHMGYLFSAMMASLALGAFLLSHIKSEGREKRLILWTQVYVGVAVMLAATFANLPAGILFFLLHEVGRGFWAPVKESFLHHRIPSHERATIASFCSITPHIGGSLGLVVSGGIAQLFGIGTAWMVAGIVLVSGAVLIAKKQ